MCAHADTGPAVRLHSDRPDSVRSHGMRGTRTSFTTTSDIYSFFLPTRVCKDESPPTPTAHCEAPHANHIRPRTRHTTGSTSVSAFLSTTAYARPTNLNTLVTRHSKPCVHHISRVYKVLRTHNIIEVHLGAPLLGASAAWITTSPVAQFFPSVSTSPIADMLTHDQLRSTNANCMCNTPLADATCLYHCPCTYDIICGSAYAADAFEIRTSTYVCGTT